MLKHPKHPPLNPPLVSIEKDKYMTPAHSLKTTRSSHSAQYRRHQTYSDALKNSFFPRTIPHWNSLPPSVANRLGKSLKPTIIASFSYNSFKRLANWSLEDMFFGNTFKSLRVAPPPFYNTHENIRLMSTVCYILSAPSRFWGRKHYFCRFYSIN